MTYGYASTSPFDVEIDLAGNHVQTPEVDKFICVDVKKLSQSLVGGFVEKCGDGINDVEVFLHRTWLEAVVDDFRVP